MLSEVATQNLILAFIIENPALEIWHSQKSQFYSLSLV